jgi:hypothetical protein
MSSNNTNMQSKKRKASQAPEQERGAKKQKQIQPEHVASKQARANEIDDIFSKKITSKSTNKSEAAPVKKTGSKPKLQPKATQKKQNASTSKDDDDVFWKDSRGNMNSNRKYTEDGLPIYNEDELKIGKGGGTCSTLSIYK